MAAGVYNFTVDQGSTWKRSVIIKDSAGAVLNLTGYTARMQVRRRIESTTVLIELTTTNGAITVTPTLGKLNFALSASQTATLSQSGVYDLEIVSSGGEVTRMLEGQFIVKPEVTR